MKRTLLILPTLLVACLLLVGDASAWDGEVYFGKYFDQGEWPAEYVSGVTVGHDILVFDNWLTMRPHLTIETYMDEYIDGYFHPFRVRYFAGMDWQFPHNIYLRLEHLCDHPVDRFGAVEQYSLIQIGIKF